MFRKIRKLFNRPNIFFRDALLNKYPLHLTQGVTHFGGENSIIDACENIDNQFIPDFDIDVVYTWVSDLDLQWKNKRDTYSHLWDGHTTPHALEKSRFDDHNEIYYSLLSLEMYMPWVRNIYIITDSQIPPTPIGIREKVHIVDHRDIIPEKYLPTFNSHVIEACLHNINDLSEHFIYFNDDFFVAREISAAHFFHSNEIASIFIGNKNINFEHDKLTSTSIACKNSNDLFLEMFDITFNHYLVHTYVPLRKSYYILAYDIFGERILNFLTNKFRSTTDINMATFFVPYLQYIYGVSTPKIDISYYFNIRSPTASFYYDRLLDAKAGNNLPHSFCANDFSSCEFPYANCHDEFNKFAQKFYDYFN